MKKFLVKEVVMERNDMKHLSFNVKLKHNLKYL